jgi:hypothetical protein
VDQGSIESSFLTWLMALGKILNMDSLRKGHVMVDWCYMFKSDEESVDHLLLHCGVACALKRAFFIRFGLSWVMPRRVVDQYVCWWTCGSTRSVVVWKMVPSTLLWCLWREYNNRCFEDPKGTLAKIMSLFFNTLYTWTAAFLAPLVL